MISVCGGITIESKGVMCYVGPMSILWTQKVELFYAA